MLKGWNVKFFEGTVANFSTLQLSNVTTTSFPLKYLPRFPLFGGKAKPSFIGSVEIGQQVEILAVVNFNLGGVQK